MKIKLALLGCGNMGSAITIGLSKKSKAFSVYCFDPQLKKAKWLAQKMKGKGVKTTKELKGCEYFLIACKPQQIDTLNLDLPDHAKIISIMAGVSVLTVQKKLKCKKVARVMPNMPALIGEGAIGIYFKNFNAKEKKVVQTLFEAVGKVEIVRSEKEIDLITIGISAGSGYLFEIARIFIDRLVEMGLKKQVAGPLVKQMLKGSSLLMQKSKDSPEILRNKVTSKGGTTQAGLQIFKKARLEKIFQKALTAAFQRSQKLS